MTRLIAWLAQRRVVWITGILTFGLMVGMNWWALEGGLPSNAIVAFELAGTPERTQRLLNAWGATGTQHLYEIVVVDIIAFIPNYAAWRAGILERLKRPRWAVWLPLLAAAFDYVENTCEVILLSNPSGTPAWIFGLGTACASLKFGLLVVALATAALPLRRAPHAGEPPTGSAQST